MANLVYKGSVKNVFEGSHKDSYVFEYSDRYSIFDWGEMPDQISHKGEALNLMGFAFFKFLEKELGLSHHMLGLVGEAPTNKCEVKKINVVRPHKSESGGYNYSAYQDKLTLALVPLEVIFRLGLPKGNSLSKRLTRNPDLIHELDLKAVPQEGEMLEKPIIDFSTKLENGDRYLTYSEAQAIAGLSTEEFLKLKNTATNIAVKLSEFHSQMGVELWDGKIEFAFVQGADGVRDFMLVDSIGIDELRIVFKGQSISKEFLREVYLPTPWYQALQAAKLDAKTSTTDFREICKNKYHQMPPTLSEQNKLKAESLYQSYCNSVYQHMNLPQPFPTEFSVPNYVRQYL